MRVLIMRSVDLFQNGRRKRYYGCGNRANSEGSRSGVQVDDTSEAECVVGLAVILVPGR